MVKASKFVNAKYLSAGRANEINGKTLVIDSVFTEMIGQEGEKEPKLCVRFSGVEKPLVLNQGNLALLMAAFGDETENWPNNKIVLHVVMVTYGGKQVPGIQIEPVKS